MRILAASAATALLLIAGWYVPHRVVGDGIDHFADDPAKQVVAQGAYNGAWMLQDNPVLRGLTPAVRVTEVKRVPGHCSAGDPGSNEPNADYQARVQLYTFFAIPAGVVYATCGGWHWSRIPPSA
jgi:hypothetical protein